MHILAMTPASRFCLIALALLILNAASAAEPLPYLTEPAFGDLKFNQPLAIVSPPHDTGRVFILEKPGRIMLIDPADPKRPARVFFDLRDRVGDDSSEQGVLALAFHPDWK